MPSSNFQSINTNNELIIKDKYNPYLFFLIIYINLENFLIKKIIYITYKYINFIYFIFSWR